MKLIINGSVSTLKFIGFSLINTLLVGCGNGTQKELSRIQNLPYHDSDDPQWIYNGPLPYLQNSSLIVSLKTHTVRVTGDLPASYSSPLPFYAIPEESLGRLKIHVTYPIATGDLQGFNDNGSPVRNGPGLYPDILAFPYNPYGIGKKPVEWGGFPFLEYNHERSLAFHGPITHFGSWQLLRGPVSHGCNRMQGEHVVEMSHLLGVDMTSQLWNEGDSQSLPTPVLVTEDADKIDTRFVDVDYPSLPEVVRPTKNVRMFPTWDAMNHTQFVCEMNVNLPLGPNHCQYLTNQGNAITDNVTVASVPCPIGTNPLTLSAGGRICVQTNEVVFGPNTESMRRICQQQGGEASFCAKTSGWPLPYYRSVRGENLCPYGSHFDVQTGYCADLRNSFGPFNTVLVQKCVKAKGGLACQSPIWSRPLLLSLL